jgi:hypothetical protein
MKLSPKALKKISGSRDHSAKITRTKLALTLNYTESWVRRCILENKDNGPLTTFAALQIIGEDTGLSQEQILVEDGAGHRVRKNKAAA